MKKLILLLSVCLFLVNCRNKIEKMDPPIVLKGVSAKGEVLLIDRNNKILELNNNEITARVISNMYENYCISFNDTIINE